jgi:hypothetical protein
MIAICFICDVKIQNRADLKTHGRFARCISNFRYCNLLMVALGGGFFHFCLDTKVEQKIKAA